MPAYVQRPSVSAEHLEAFRRIGPLYDSGQHARRAIPILDVGSVDHGMNEIALGVGEDVTLASLDLLACVVAARPAAFCSFHALAADHPGAGRCLAARRFASDQQQGVIEREPQAVIAPRPAGSTAAAYAQSRSFPFASMNVWSCHRQPFGRLCGNDGKVPVAVVPACSLLDERTASVDAPSDASIKSGYVGT
jgi:hypothetical protein